MPTERQLIDALSKIHEDIGGGFIAASMVDLESGMTLAVRKLSNPAIVRTSVNRHVEKFA